MASNEPEVVGGPMAQAFAWMIQGMMRDSGSPDLVIVETDDDGNEMRRIKLKNATLLRVEVPEVSDAVESVMELKYDKIVCPLCGGTEWGGGTDCQPRPWCMTPDCKGMQPGWGDDA